MRFLLPQLFLAAALCSNSSWAESPRLFRISTENSQSHGQTEMVQSFAERVSAAAGDRLKVEFLYGASLYSDANVLPALSRGMVEMAVPGIWQFDRFVPDAAAFMLPVFYGQETDAVISAADGPVGRAVSAAIEKRLPVLVPGGFLDLGWACLFLVKGVSPAPGNLQGLRIRTAGGKANEARIAALGGSPLTVPFPDLPRYLETGLIDGVLTTFETVDSGRLDRYGLSSALVDNEYYAFYVPVVNAAFWRSLDDELRSIIKDAWNGSLADGRIRMRAAQSEARKRLERRGLSVTVPPSDESAAVRSRLRSGEDALAHGLGISDTILLAVREALVWQAAR